MLSFIQSAIRNPKSAISCDGDCTDAKTDADPAQNTGDEHLYYCQDANFNVTALVDDYDGAVVERYMYSPYGEVTVLHGDRDSSGTDTSASEWSARTSNTFENALLYCGYYHDWETGLYHVRRRYYHPPLGCWTSRDPIGVRGGVNLYEYVEDAPGHAVDPFGLSPVDSWSDFKATAELLEGQGLTMWNTLITCRWGLTVGCTREGKIDFPLGIEAPTAHNWYPDGDLVNTRMQRIDVVKAGSPHLTPKPYSGGGAYTLKWVSAGGYASVVEGEPLPSMPTDKISAFKEAATSVLNDAIKHVSDRAFTWEFEMEWEAECKCDPKTNKWKAEISYKGAKTIKLERHRRSAHRRMKPVYWQRVH